jgi:hypothetical protein
MSVGRPDHAELERIGAEPGRINNV